MGIGILGEKADVQRFTDLLAADFNMRAQRCATKIFKGRIQLLPVEAEIPEDDEVQ